MSRDPRPSTDDQRAPLLTDADAENNDVGNGEHPTTLERLANVAHEPITALSKVLLVLALIFLLLSSVFLGLFAGAQHKLKLEKERNHAPVVVTTTLTHTTTEHATSTATRTKSDIHTTTAPPFPIPTIPIEKKQCFEPECIVLAASVLSSLDTSADPCENFYDFATGGWRDEHPLPADKGIYGQFNDLAKKNFNIIQRIVESSDESLVPSYDAQLLTKVRGLYHSCMDESRIETVGSEPLEHLVRTVRKLYRGASVDITSTEEAAEDHETLKKGGLTAALAFMHSRGIDALFTFDIEGDVGRDPNFMTLWFSQSDYGLPSKEYFAEKDIRQLYEGVIEKILVALPESTELDSDPTLPPPFLSQGGEDDHAWPPWPWPPWGGEGEEGRKKPNHSERARALAPEVFKFERQLAEASLDLDVLGGDPFATYNPTPTKNVTKAFPQFKLQEYLAVFAPRFYPNEIVVTYPPYIASLSSILDEWSTDVVEAYLVVRAALAFGDHLSPETSVWKAVHELKDTLRGVKPGTVGDRSEYCIGKVDNALGFAVGKFFVEKTFAGSSREVATKVITDVVEVFKRSLKKISWMDKKSANAAAEKASAIRVKVGYPISPNTTDARSLLYHYKLVKINEGEFFENMLSASVSETIKTWAKLGRPRNMEEWKMSPATVNAYFNPPGNEIVFPAGILRPPFFTAEWPGYLNYGSFGAVAAHELTHAFDSAGRMYNQNGKLEEWWTNKTSEGFQIRQTCLSKQYSDYFVLDGKGNKVYVNGNLTSGENIGDSGIIQSFRAWQAQYDSSLEAGHEYLLPGLNFTREQLFFLSFARSWAQQIKPAAAVQRVRTDPHSPNRFRVDGTVRNVPEFAEAFKCSPKAKLNPPNKDRCLLW